MSIEKKVQTDKHNAGDKKYSITRRDCNKLVFAIFLRLSPAAIELKHDFIVIKPDDRQNLRENPYK